MAAKVYALSFGSGDPRTYTGLTPTFLLFFDNTGTGFTPPSITEMKSGSGFYGFSYTISATQSIFFLINGITSSLGSFQYINGSIDPVQAVDQQVTISNNGISSLQTGLTALTNAVGFTSDSYGSQSLMPISVLGFLNRLTQFNEGDSIFTASSGVWQIYNMTSLGVTTLLRQKTLVNNSTVVTKVGQ